MQRTQIATRLATVETTRTRDLTIHLPDGSTETRRAKPRGLGWRIVRDSERHTTWQRRKRA